MEMKEARLKIARAYATRDPDEMAEAHHAACRATVSNVAEAAGLIFLLKSELRALAATGNQWNAENIAAALDNLLQYLDPRPNPLH
jgi:hypothetical protein